VTAVLRLARFAVVYELRLWRSLFRWVFRRPVTREPGARTFGYAGVLAPLMWMFIGLSAVEIPILHLMLPWASVRKVALVIGFYGLLWMIGLLAAMRIHPHVVGAAGVRVRSGFGLDFTIPWTDIDGVRARPHSAAPGRSIRVEDERGRSVLCVIVSSQTSVEIILRGPTVLPVTKAAGRPVTEVHLHADDPQAMAARIREHLAARPASDVPA
jgi:hypothetical protein